MGTVLLCLTNRLMSHIGMLQNQALILLYIDYSFLLWINYGLGFVYLMVIRIT